MQYTNLSADYAIDTKTQDFGDFVHRADAVIDTVGGKTQDQLFTLAKPGGIVVSAVNRLNGRLTSHHDIRSDYFIVYVNNRNWRRSQDCSREGQHRYGADPFPLNHPHRDSVRSIAVYLACPPTP